MGDPRRRRKKYNSPGHPYEKTRLEAELIIVGKYGLRNKRELWRARTNLGNYRKQTRSLLALDEEDRKSKEIILLNKLRKIGIINEESQTDDILALDVESILRRRLQTRVLEKGLAGTIHQARQLIVHRHIMINGRIMVSPSYLVPLNLDEKIEYSPESPFNSPEHAMNPSLSRGTSIIEIPTLNPRKFKRR